MHFNLKAKHCNYVAIHCSSETKRFISTTQNDETPALSSKTAEPCPII
jgi:hypothetical protein